MHHEPFFFSLTRLDLGTDQHAMPCYAMLYFFKKMPTTSPSPTGANNLSVLSLTMSIITSPGQGQRGIIGRGQEHANIHCFFGACWLQVHSAKLLGNTLLALAKLLARQYCKGRSCGWQWMQSITNCTRNYKFRTDSRILMHHQVNF